MDNQLQRRFSRRIVDFSSSSSSNNNHNGPVLRSEDAAVISAAALVYLNDAGVLDLSDASLSAVLFFVPTAAILHAVAGAAEQAWATNQAIGYEPENEGQDSAKGGVAVRASAFLGEGQRGAFATRPLAEGTFLAEYRGETLSLDEYMRRYHSGGKQDQQQQQQQQQPDFVWRVNDDCFLDASDEARSNWCRFVNHAPTAARAATDSEGEGAAARTANVLVLRRSPLLQPLPTTRWLQRWLPRVTGSNSNFNSNGGVYFFAARDIEEGEEFLCDYGPRFWEREGGAGEVAFYRDITRGSPPP